MTKKNPVGRPPEYKDVQEIQEKIDAYFKDCEGKPYIGPDGEAVTDKYGNPVIVDKHPPTVTGLALALGFTSRRALLNYEAKPQFVHTIMRAKAKCEQYAEERLYDRDGTNGAQFSLKCNFGWNEHPQDSIDTEDADAYFKAAGLNDENKNA